MMPADVARCSGTDCPHRDACRRYTEPAPPGHPRVVRMQPPPGVLQNETCPYFLPALRYDESCFVTFKTDRSKPRKTS